MICCLFVTKDGSTALINAVKRRDFDVVILLLDGGAAIDMRGGVSYFNAQTRCILLLKSKP